MNYIMLGTNDLLFSLYCSVKRDELPVISSTINNLKEFFDHIKIDESLSKQGLKDLATELEVSPVKVKQIINSIKRGTYKGELSDKAKNILENSVESTCYYTCTKTEKLKLSDLSSFTLVEEDNSVTIRLSAFQSKLVKYIKTKLSRYGSFYSGLENMQMLLRKVQYSETSIEVFGKLLSKINEMSEENIVDLISSNETFNLQVYLQDIQKLESASSDSVNNVFKTFISEQNLSEEVLKDKEKLGEAVSEYLDKSLENLNFELINRELGTSLTKYQMMNEILNLQNLELYGIWVDSDYMRSNIDNIHIYLVDEESLKTPNVEFIKTVLKPIIQSEYNYRML